MNMGVSLVHGCLTALARSPATLLASVGSGGQADRQRSRGHDHNRGDQQANSSGHRDLPYSMSPGSGIISGSKPQRQRMGVASPGVGSADTGAQARWYSVCYSMTKAMTSAGVVMAATCGVTRT